MPSSSAACGAWAARVASPSSSAPSGAKAGHGTLYYGRRFTIVRSLRDDLKPGTLRAMLRQLGLGPDDLR